MPTTLGNHITTQKGFAFKSDWYRDIGAPIVKVSDFTDDAIDATGLTHIPIELAAEYHRYRLTTGDVVIQTVGSWPSNPKSVVGKAIKTPFEANGALLNQNAVKLDPNEGLDKAYLFYLLRNTDFKNYIVGCAQGAASQASITLEAIRDYTFDLPPLPTQRRIAEILSAYDDLIEVNARRIRILEGMAQSVYRETVQAPSVQGGVETLSTTSPLPEGWEVKELGDIAKEVRRSIQPSEIDPETPYFGLEHLPRKSLALSDWGKAGDVHSTKLAFKKGEILFGKIRPYFHKVGVAPLDGVASSDTIIIVPRSPEYFGLVLNCVFSEDFVNQATLTSQGTKMPRANWDVLVKYPIAVPPKPILEKFNQTIQDIIDLLTVLLFKNRNLRQTRDLLLPRLVGGEVAV